MPMIDIQKRHAQVFRLRLGETQGGRPVKLTEAIKVTSASEEIVTAFTTAYGGTVGSFAGQGSKDRFGALLPVTEIPIMVLPGDSLVQWWESYAKSVCQRRCDGETETLSGKACSCPVDIEERMALKGACRPMTRINVLCPEVAVVGAGSLVSHGLIAAETLPQSIAVAEAALSRGLMVPGILRVVEHKSRNHYVIPQIEIVGVSLRTLANGEVPLAVGAASRPALPAPKSAEGATTDQEKEEPAEVGTTSEGSSGTTDGGDGGVTAPPSSSTRQTPGQRAIMATARRQELDDVQRHAVIRYATDGRCSSLAEVTEVKDGNAVLSALRDLKAGALVFDADGDLVVGA